MTTALVCDPMAVRIRADAARFQLLARMLPFQRHEVLGHLSLLRMAVLMARRKSERGGWDGRDGALTTIEQMLRQAVGDMSALRWWDRPAGLTEAPATVFDACQGAIKALLSISRHRLESAQTSPKASGGVAWKAPQAHLALMAAALHASDRVAGAWDWRLQLHHDGVSGEGRFRAPIDPAATLRREGDGIEEWMATALAIDAGARLEVGQGRWMLYWAPSRDAP